MKKAKLQIKLQVLSGMANPSPPVGPALGSRGVNIIKFCNEFNNRTKDSAFGKGVLLPVIINVYNDKSFDFIVKTPPTSVLIKMMLKISKASKLPGKDIVSEISLQTIKEIAVLKKIDLTASSIDNAMKTIIGTASSMGIRVVD